ncbi:MAG: class I SAM-dependent methyltransferase [Roseivirga sp.]|nr:class I SAM-dependent methyltransferase [Roseivirga sp.]
MARKGGFDAVAPLYDTLSYVVFGNALKRAQLAFLEHLPTTGRALVIGGGTGWILKEVVKRRPGLQVDYVEASEKMLALSRRKVASDNHQVNFIHGTEKSVPSSDYDCIITNFFLDVFSENSLKRVMSLLREKLGSGGMWICTDFRSAGKRNHQFLIWLMHRFFGLFASLEANRLLDFRPFFDKEGMILKEESEFRNGLIFSALYRPNE